MLPSAVSLLRGTGGRRPDSLTYEANDAADQRVEVAAVSRHDDFLLGQESLPRRFHHVHGHLADENLHRFRETQT